MQNNLNIKALGKSASIGSFYDGINSEFITSMSIFKKDISHLITTLDDPSTVYEFDSTNTYSEKFSKFDINGNLKVKLMAGLGKIEGAGNYLKEEKTDCRNHKISLIYKCRTKKDSLNINDAGLVEHFALDNFHNYTHFVTAIKWGADVVITIEEVTSEAESKNEKVLSANALSNKLLATLSNISGKGNLNSVDVEKKFDSNIKIKINADIPGLNTIPTCMKEMLELFNDIPSKLKDCNNGKGKPIEYELTSLCVIKQMFKIDSIRLSDFSNDLDNHSIDHMVSEFDEYLANKQKFNFFVDQALMYKEFIDKKDIESIEEKKKELNKKETNFRREIFDRLVEIRKAQSTEAKKLRDEFEAKVDTLIEEGKKLMEDEPRKRIEKNIVFFRYLLNTLNVKILEQDQKIGDLLITELRTIKEVFILVGKVDERDTDDWIDTYKMFTNLIDEDKKNQSADKKAFYFADLDIHKYLLDKHLEGKKCIIVTYKNGTKGYKGFKHLF